MIHPPVGYVNPSDGKYKKDGPSEVQGIAGAPETTGSESNRGAAAQAPQKPTGGEKSAADESPSAAKQDHAPVKLDDRGDGVSKHTGIGDKADPLKFSAKVQEIDKTHKDAKKHK